MADDIRQFGPAPDGQAVQAVRLQSDRLSVIILTRGAIVQDVRLADVPWPLTLGGPDVAGYAGPMGYFGAVVGPVANRIGTASARIGDEICRFPANEGTTLLHGGANGTHARIWTIDSAGADHVTLRVVLAAGEDGFPGRRKITARFSVAGAALTLSLTATTDAPTLMNLANHSYWNLDGEGTIAGHRLTVHADHYLPVDDALLPIGEVRAVTGAFDMRGGRVLDLGEGFDHNFCTASAPRALTAVARLTGTRGVTLDLASTEPGLQIYDGRALHTAPFVGHAGTPYGPFAGLALEPQRWPDAPNHPQFPQIGLQPGETWHQETRWGFSTG